MKQIPQVDLTDFISKDSTKKQLFVSQLGAAFEEIGFVALKGHFLSPEIMENLYSEVKAFFNLPDAVKRKY
ncbi:2-oxoglutarate and iron-dependent oxygenase domain-containing protein, partial [Flavobacteriaceae bacterium]|nr:2-oxoglutarate and iron-dependent oxygenase domain-containing protein [Flavobacteriaceae bacterium]